MIVLTNTSDQTVSSGGVITFNSVVLHTGCAERYRENTGMVKLANSGIYEVQFHGNVSSDTADTTVELTVMISGAELAETEMLYTPSTADIYGNVSAATAVRNYCGDYDSITVQNTGSADILVAAGCCLFIKRIA